MDNCSIRCQLIPETICFMDLIIFLRNDFWSIHIIFIECCLLIFICGDLHYFWCVWPTWIYFLWPIEKLVSIGLWRSCHVFQIFYWLLLAILISVARHILCTFALTYACIFWSHVSETMCIFITRVWALIVYNGPCLFLSPDLWRTAYLQVHSSW